MDALVNKRMYIYSYEEQFMPKIQSPFYYGSLMMEANKRNMFIPLRNSLDPSYDAKYKSEEEQYSIGCMPSFKNNRLKAIKKLRQYMCPESGALLVNSLENIRRLKNRVRQIKEEEITVKDLLAELVLHAEKAREKARNNYKKILFKSKYIFTDAVEKAMVRKYIELPYAGSIICTKKNG